MDELLTHQHSEPAYYIKDCQILHAKNNKERGMAMQVGQVGLDRNLVSACC